MNDTPTPTPPIRQDPESTRAFTSMLLLLGKALKKAKVPYVEVTDEECLNAVKELCPVKIVQETDPNNPTQRRVRAYLNGPIPEQERKRIITLS